MKATYTENQKGTWIVIILVIASMVLLYGIIDQDGFRPSFWPVFVIIWPLFVVVAFMFYRLRTEVYSEMIKLTFGIGAVKKKIPLKNVKSVKVVQNKWYFGWGIRFYGKGWMWNIWGLGAVELEFNNKRSLFRIGSQNPDSLKEEIEKQLIK